MAKSKKNTSQRPAPAPQPESPKDEKQAQLKNDQNQFWSIILFASGILTALMVLITGSAGWYAIHKFLLGMFGLAAFFVPMILLSPPVQMFIIVLWKTIKSVIIYK